MLLGPQVQGRPERVVADPVAKRLQSHRTADVHRPVEQVVDPGVSDHAPPKGGVARDRSPDRLERPPRGPEPLVPAPEPFRVGREALVEPDVLPAVDGHQVAEPLVRQLVHDDRLAVREEDARVDGPRLRLQREAEPAGSGEHPAHRLLRVQSETGLARAPPAPPTRPVSGKSPPPDSNGYGPNRLSRKSRISGSRRTEARTRGRTSGSIASIPGTPLDVVRNRIVHSPTSNVARELAIGCGGG